MRTIAHVHLKVAGGEAGSMSTPSPGAARDLVGV